MPVRRSLLGVVVAGALLAGGCSLLPHDDAPPAAACREALTRSVQLTDARARVLARTEAVTEMDPEGTAAVLAHREAAQRAIFGPIARLAARGDDRAQQYRHRRNECRQDRASAGLAAACRSAFTLSSRLANDYVEATATRVDFWSQQVAMAQNAWMGRAAATRRAIDRWDRLRADHERELGRLARTTDRHRRAVVDCRDTL